MKTVVRKINLTNTYDVQSYLENIHTSLPNQDRIRISTINSLWQPLMKTPNWLSISDLTSLLHLAHFEPISIHYSIPFPFLKHLSLHQDIIARKQPETVSDKEYSVSIIIPARNEAGTIEQLVKRIPRLGTSTELIFIEGFSNDKTYNEILRVQKLYTTPFSIRLVRQTKVSGKGNAVRLGCAKATGDIIMILDADMSVDPEELTKFYHALRLRKGELIMGSRLVYPMERQSMQFLNIIGNKFFSLMFTWLLDQPIKDTLCGTKAFFRSDYQQIVRNRSRFGAIDPFGDFDLIFGAAWLHLKIIEIPIHYRARSYGTTNIRRFSHGILLLKMLYIAIVTFKFNQRES